jgi:hypothetical protein
MADVSNVGMAISSGDMSTTYSKDKAFDNNTATEWHSSLSDINVKNTAYIGRSFGKNVKITSIGINNVYWGGTYVATANLQYSNDSTNWFTLVTNARLEHDCLTVIQIPSPVSALYFRLLATDYATGCPWAVRELQLYDATPDVKNYPQCMSGGM